MKKCIVIGSGLAGSTVSRLLAEFGFKVTLYEKRNHLGGNVYDYFDENGILVHKYGPHIFHTNNKTVINFINRFTTLNNYHHQALGSIKNKEFPIPFNLNSLIVAFPKTYNLKKKALIDYFGKNKKITISELLKVNNNLHLKKIGKWIYKNIYYGYTLKHWGISPKELDPSVLSRVPIYINHKNQYFSDKYQGLPKEGYTNLIEKILNHPNINIIINQDVSKIIKIIDNKIYLKNKLINCPFIYTGQIDSLFNFKYNPLPYRAINCVFKNYSIDKYQKIGIVNYTRSKKYTRIIEFKQMTKQIIKNSTTISKEYPGAYNPNNQKFNIPSYPIPSPQSDKIYQEYLHEAKKINNLYLCGRLAEYKYFNMDEVILRAISVSKKIITYLS